MKNVLRGVLSLLLCFTVIGSAFPVLAVDGGGERFLTVGAETETANTSNPFTEVNGGGEYGGISLAEDYGSGELSVALISRERDRFIIELNGHTLTLAYLALNMSLEVRGEGTLSVSDGIVIYNGEFYLGDGVRLETESELPVIAYGAGARIRIGDGAVVDGGEKALAELAVSYNCKSHPIVFDSLNASAEGFRYRIIYEAGRGEYPAVATASVASFPTAEEAEAAFRNGFVSVVNPLAGFDTESDEDDSSFKVSGDLLSVIGVGAVLSHANISLDGSIGVNLYFDLSDTEDGFPPTGALLYTGVGNGGRIEIPEKGADGKYKFTVPISPMDMGKTIVLRFEGDLSGRSWEYSVAKYARYILSDTKGVFGREIKDLIASMLTYGAAIQRLNGETEALADSILSEFEEYDTAEEIKAMTQAAVDRMYASGYAYKNIYYRDSKAHADWFEGISLAVNDVTAIRVYLNEACLTEGQYSYYVSYRETNENGSAYLKTSEIDGDAVRESGYAQLSGIPSGRFGQVFRLSVKDSQKGRIEAYCEATVFAYAEMLYGSSAEESLERALAEAIIWYGICSVSYFSPDAQ